MASACTRTARIIAVTASSRLTMSSSLRRSTMSATAPASTAKRNTGSVVAAWTAATIWGEGARLVISQPAPTSFIHVPMFDTTVAPQRTRYAFCRKGLQGLPESVVVAVIVVGPWIVGRQVSWGPQPTLTW